MSKYGLTPDGPNIKRLDVILESMHEKLTDRWGVNTQQNPSSFLNHALTNIADAIAEVWEFAESVYYAKYPATAEGLNLDNAAQYGGSVREPASKSYYPIHCTGKDGTKLATGTMIASNTNPPTLLTLLHDREITRTAFNSVKIKIVSLKRGETYSIGINGSSYSHHIPETPVEGETGTSCSEDAVFLDFCRTIKTPGFAVSYDGVGKMLTITCDDPSESSILTLSENMTTETVTSVVTFATVDTGDIKLPDGTITKIVKANAGLTSVVNAAGYIAGRKEETDAEFRQSYTDKIFNRSQTMLDSIRSSILNNVQGVKSVSPYENETDEFDEWGRPPHSIEIVVDGGDDYEIAQQIFSKKAAGINTYGMVEKTIIGNYDENFTIRFNRPEVIYVWFKLSILCNKTEMPQNYETLLKDIVIKNMNTAEAGKDIVPQEYMSEFYKVCPGLNYVDILIYTTSDVNDVPSDSDYKDRVKAVTIRQKAQTSASMIVVRDYE